MRIEVARIPPEGLTLSGGAKAAVAEYRMDSGNWPTVNYGNSSHAVIISPPLGETITSVQLTHAIEVEYLHAGVVMDGATAFWQGIDGNLIPADPMDGWNAQISPQSNNSRNGAGAFADLSAHPG